MCTYIHIYMEKQSIDVIMSSSTKPDHLKKIKVLLKSVKIGDTDMPSPISKIYHGEVQCQGIKGNGQRCANHAYYLVDKMFLCGVHSAKCVGRMTLPINPHKKEYKIAQLHEHERTIELCAQENSRLGIKGKVICYHMGMMKEVDKRPGYLNIFPNYKHGNRTDGLGMPSLSPMAMGPINHLQPDLPPAKNLENFFQSNKAFPSEVDIHGNPKPEFYQTQIDMYLDPVPHRHKEASGHENIPVYSVWVTPEKKELHLSYIESRQVYCHFYEQFALKSPDFHKLQQLIQDGYNLQICGYDSYQPIHDLETHYLDPSRPFGHELVLYTLLTTSPPYPWQIHQTISFTDPPLKT